MKMAWTCMFTPRLYKIYREGPKDAIYQPQGLEKWGDKVISSANTIFNIGLYTSPFLCMYVFRRGFFSSSEAKFLIQCFGGLGCLLAVCIALRGIGRCLNPKYVAFVNALTQPQTEKQALLDGLRKYDFESHAWPVTYSVPTRAIESRFDNPFSRCANPDLSLYKRATIQLLAYMATHIFGLRLIYPGSVSVIHHILWNPLLQGRTLLVEDFDGKRAKIGTADSNSIDTMFVDNRPSSNGKTLVVCCEGNSGFYEIGLMTTPAKAGFSVLGWNHPGFAGSTGQPYPEQENNAIDAVMQYAINELGFLPEDIIMYGWSIGGYSATWAAVNYPVKGLILDATFDDLLPLAQNQMPSSWALLVKEVVRSYVNLNVGDLLVKYNGPVQLVRRLEDEIISLRPGDLSTNRGNDLLVRLVESRHTTMTPETRHRVRLFVDLNESRLNAYNTSSTDEEDHRAINLISTYLRDIRSTHCTPLSDLDFDRFVNIMLKTEKN